MSQCRQQTAAEGKPSPRTCPRCGLGPCTDPRHAPPSAPGAWQPGTVFAWTGPGDRFPPFVNLSRTTSPGVMLLSLRSPAPQHGGGGTTVQVTLSDDAVVEMAEAIRKNVGPAKPAAKASGTDSADDRLRVAARIERAVRDVFEKRFAGRQLPYEQTRELAWLERDVVEHVASVLSDPMEATDAS